MDKLFVEKFGWKPRSEGVFCGTEGQALMYGNLYSVWPLDAFKFVWSPSVRDMFVDVIWPYKRNPEATNLQTIVNTYTDSDLKHAIRSAGEISLHCKSYYAINNENSQLIKKFL